MRSKKVFPPKIVLENVVHERVLLQLQAVDCSELDRTTQNNLCVIREKARTGIDVVLIFSLIGACKVPKDRFLRTNFICELAEVDCETSVNLVVRPDPFVAAARRVRHMLPISDSLQMVFF